MPHFKITSRISVKHLLLFDNFDHDQYINMIYVFMIFPKPQTADSHSCLRSAHSGHNHLPSVYSCYSIKLSGKSQLRFLPERIHCHSNLFRSRFYRDSVTPDPFTQELNLSLPNSATFSTLFSTLFSTPFSYFFSYLSPTLFRAIQNFTHILRLPPLIHQLVSNTRGSCIRRRQLGTKITASLPSGTHPLSFQSLPQPILSRFCHS